MDFKDIRNNARLKVHENFKLSAIAYLPDGQRLPVTCRLQRSLESGGDLPQTGFDYPDRVEITPRLVFLKAEHIPDIDNIYSFGDDGIYIVRKVDGTDGITITAETNRIADERLEDYPGP